MKYRSEGPAAYVLRMSRWHRWFAWRPVRVGTHECRWLEFVERKRVWYGIGETSARYTEYRPAPGPYKS